MSRILLIEDNEDLAFGLRTSLENVGHTGLHYGNMITYMRMLGLVPPSS